MAHSKGGNNYFDIESISSKAKVVMKDIETELGHASSIYDCEYPPLVKVFSCEKSEESEISLNIGFPKRRRLQRCQPKFGYGRYERGKSRKRYSPSKKKYITLEINEDSDKIKNPKKEEFTTEGTELDESKNSFKKDRDDACKPTSLIENNGNTFEKSVEDNNFADNDYEKTVDRYDDFCSSEFEEEVNMQSRLNNEIDASDIIEKMDSQRGDKKGKSLRDFIEEMEEKHNKTSVNIYGNIGMDRRLFSKIKSKPYHDRKTIYLLAIGLNLTVEEFYELLKIQGYSLRECEEDYIFDFCIMWFIKQQIYDINLIDMVLERKTGKTLLKHKCH